MTAWLVADSIASDDYPAVVASEGNLLVLAGRGRRRYSKPASLDAHKLALFSIERVAAQNMATEMRKARTTVDMFRTARTQLKAVHQVAAKMAVSHVTQEFAELGIEPVKTKLPDNTYIRQLYKDLQLSLRDPDLTRAEKLRRSQLAVVSAANRAYTDAQLALYQAASIAMPDKVVQKRWETNLASDPCPTCRALHGQTVGLDDEFNHAGLAVYGDLQGPPRHPNCRCRIVVVHGTA